MAHNNSTTWHRWVKGGRQIKCLFGLLSLLIVLWWTIHTCHSQTQSVFICECGENPTLLSARGSLFDNARRSVFLYTSQRHTVTVTLFKRPPACDVLVQKQQDTVLNDVLRNATVTRLKLCAQVAVTLDKVGNYSFALERAYFLEQIRQKTKQRSSRQGHVLPNAPILWQTWLTNSQRRPLTVPAAQSCLFFTLHMWALVRGSFW